MKKRCVLLAALLLAACLLLSGCGNGGGGRSDVRVVMNTRTPVPAVREAAVLDDEIRFRGYEWYALNSNESYKEIREAYPDLECSGALTDMYTNTKAGWTVREAGSYRIEQFEYSPKKDTVTYVQGKEVHRIYTEYLFRDSDRSRQFICGAYEFWGDSDLYDYFLSALTEKYGEPGGQNFRELRNTDILGNHVTLGTYSGYQDYVEWKGQNNTTLELSCYKFRGGSYSVLIRYYVPDAYAKLDNVEKQAEEDAIRREEQKKQDSMDNGDL